MTPSSSPDTETIDGKQPLARLADGQGFYWLYAAIVAVIGLVAYGLLPSFGLDRLESLSSIRTVWGGAVALIGGVLYWRYFNLVRERPHYLLFGFFIFYPVFSYGLDIATSLGFGLRNGYVVLVLYSLPCLALSMRGFLYLWHEVPHFKYFVIFAGMVVLYYFVFNANAYEFRTLAKGANAYRSIAEQKTFGIFNVIASVLIAGTVFVRIDDHRRLFHMFNRVLMAVLFSYSVLSLILFPLGQYVMIIEGYKRMMLIFDHPNAFSHYMAFMSVYMLGLYFYYKNQTGLETPPISPRSILTTFVLSLVACFLGLSKTAIGILAICIPLVFLMNAMLSPGKSQLGRYLLIFAGLFGLAIIGMQATGVMGTLMSRLENTSSFDWRLQTWERLLNDLNPNTMSLYIGNGLTAANAKIFQLTYSVNRAARGFVPSTNVHNIYVETLYDFGLLGFLWLIGLLALLKEIVIRLIAKGHPLWQRNYPLYILALTMTIYFLVLVSFDELFYTAFNPYWYFITFIFCYLWREQIRHDHELEG